MTLSCLAVSARPVASTSLIATAPPAREVVGEGAADARAGAGDDGSLATDVSHAEMPSLTAWTPASTSVVSYATTSKRRVIWRNTNVKLGQRVVLLPCLSRYQLAQPPVFQIVRCMRAWILWLYSRCASARTSKVASPRSSIVFSALAR